MLWVVERLSLNQSKPLIIRDVQPNLTNPLPVKPLRLILALKTTLKYRLQAKRIALISLLCQENLVSEHLQYFRPGEEARMLARCQFGLSRDGKCGAIMTYPIEGFPWRRNPSKTFEFEIDPELAAIHFDEVAHMQADHPDNCLTDDVLWCDHSEKANGITRDQNTDTLCHTIAIYDGDWQSTRHYYSMKEDSDVLLSSKLFETVMSLIKPHESLQTKQAQKDGGGEPATRPDSK